MTDLPDLKLKMIPAFPAAVEGGTGIAVEREGGEYSIDLDYSEFLPASPIIPDPASSTILLYDSILDTYVLVDVMALVEVLDIDPSDLLPVMDGVAAPGVGTDYSREDHVHPTDTTRAPLASPVFTGDPQAPTPAPGDNDTSIATTAFVGAAVVAVASNAAPIMDSVAAAGVSALLSRGDHVHPTDTTRAPLASPTFTGDPKAPTPATNDNDTSVATTAFVNAQIAATVPPATVAPLMDGVAAVGVATKYAREDHKHPTDTSLAPLASPTFTGDPKAPTPAPGDNDTSIATTAFVAAVAALKADLASPTFTGDPKAPTPSAADNDTSIATTAFVQNAVSAAASGFPAGTLMLFQQTTPPTGWTKQTTHNDKALRVVSGTPGSGGTSPFSTVFGLTSTNTATLNNSQVPNTPVMFLTSDFASSPLPGAGPPGINPWAKNASYASSSVYTSGSGSEGVQGGGGGHSHGIELRVQYVDLIIASKN